MKKGKLRIVVISIVSAFTTYCLSFWLFETTHLTIGRTPSVNNGFTAVYYSINDTMLNRVLVALYYPARLLPGYNVPVVWRR